MINIIPIPAKYNELEGQFRITQQTQMLYSKGTCKGKTLAANFAEYLQEILGVKPEVAATDKTRSIKGAILLTTAGNVQKLGNEGYRLTVKQDGIVIMAAKTAGLFYGLQSLQQMFPTVKSKKSLAAQGGFFVQCVRIEDVPRFKWRGMHYDPCRRFFGLAHLLKYIDYLAMQKFNVLHLHLTEDQGWRIEIKKYPELTKVSAWRNGTKNNYSQSSGDRKKHGGYYSQDEIRAIVKYAAERFITVVPEIEMPGHAQAAIAAYPELSCSGGPHEVWTQWGVSKDVYCAGNEKVFKFLEDVLGEVMELFPSKYIHIGGDECPKDRWKECPKCQRKIREEGLADEHELQSYFIRRMEKFVNSRGRKIIGWDEILEGGLAPNAAVMSWRGCEGGWKAASAGHYVVMTPVEYAYLDYKPTPETRSGQPAVLPVEKVYSFDPAKGFTTAAKKYILGGQGVMWSEYINNNAEFLHHLFPRMCALGEVLWSPLKLRNYRNFAKRAAVFVKRLDKNE